MADGDALVRADVSEADVQAYVARREALRAALLDLDRHLDELSTETRPDGERFRVAVEQFVATVQHHVEDAEAPDGLLAQILDTAAWYASRVERLRSEHDELLADAGDLLDRAGTADDVRPLLAVARQLSRRVAEHRRRGTTLLVDATMLDLAAGD